jgi:Cu/Ag efflux protein CusF
MLPWATSEALETFQKAGVISRVDSTTVNIHHQDINYRVGSDTEIRFKDVSKPDMSNFKKGDEVYLRGKILKGAYYLDLIIYMPKIPG